MSCQIVKLWDHMSDHVRPKSADILLSVPHGSASLLPSVWDCIPCQFIGVYRCLDELDGEVLEGTFNARTEGEADIRPLRRFFVDNGKTAAHSAAKFGMAVFSSPFHIICKLWHPTLKGQVTRSVWITRPHITFLQLSDHSRARVDDRALWKLQDVISSKEPTTCIYPVFLISMT